MMPLLPTRRTYCLEHRRLVLIHLVETAKVAFSAAAMGDYLKAGGRAELHHGQARRHRNYQRPLGRG